MTHAVSKQLLPIFNKPMIYYSLSTLMMAGVRDVLVVVNPEDKNSFVRLLGDGKSFGISIRYIVQNEPLGIAHAFELVPTSDRGQRVMMMLGDNLLFGSNVGTSLATRPPEGALCFGARVTNPQDFGVVEMDDSGQVVGIQEKPTTFVSDIAVPGVYFFDASVYTRQEGLTPSSRGELEITDLLKSYLTDRQLKVEILPRGTAWLDTGRASSLARASQFVEAIEENQGLLVGSPHEVAWRQGWISPDDLDKASSVFKGSDYGSKLNRLSQPREMRK